MKKTIIMAGIALVAIMACKKEIAPITKGVQPVKTASFLNEDWTALEEYKTTEDDDAVLIAELEDELLRFNNDFEMGTCSIEKAIFMLEGGVNMLNPDAHEEWTGEQTDTTYYELSMTDDLVDEFDLRGAIAELNGVIASAIATSTTKHIATDVKISAMDEESITLIAVSYFATGTTSTPWLLDNSLTLGTITANRYAGINTVCGGSSGPNAMAVNICGAEAYKTLRKFNGIASPSGNPCWTYINLTGYSSRPNVQYSNNPISAAKLLGQPSAAVLAHQGSVNMYTCVSAAELDTYAATIYSDVTNKLGKNYGVISLQMWNSNDAYLDTMWEYEKVEIGRRLFYGTCPTAINASLTYL